MADEKTDKKTASHTTVLKNKRRSRHKGVNSVERLDVLISATRDREKSVTLNILAVYNEFIGMFIEKIGLRALLKH